MEADQWIFDELSARSSASIFIKNGVRRSGFVSIDWRIETGNVDEIALLIPDLIDHDGKKMGDLLLSWFDARVGVNKVDSSHLSVSGSRHTIRTRSIVHLCHTVDDCFGCDVALIMVPPHWSINHQQRKNLSSLAWLLDDCSGSRWLWRRGLREFYLISPWNAGPKRWITQDNL